MMLNEITTAPDENQSNASSSLTSDDDEPIIRSTPRQSNPLSENVSVVIPVGESSRKQRLMVVESDPETDELEADELESVDGEAIAQDGENVGDENQNHTVVRMSDLRIPKRRKGHQSYSTRRPEPTQRPVDVPCTPISQQPPLPPPSKFT